MFNWDVAKLLGNNGSRLFFRHEHGLFAFGFYFLDFLFRRIGFVLRQNENAAKLQRLSFVLEYPEKSICYFHLANAAIIDVKLLEMLCINLNGQPAKWLQRQTFIKIFLAHEAIIAHLKEFLNAVKKNLAFLGFVFF